MRHSLAASEQDFRELPDDQIRSKANISAGNQILGKILPKIFSHKIMPNQILFNDQHFGERCFHKHECKMGLNGHFLNYVKYAQLAFFFGIPFLGTSSFQRTQLKDARISINA